MKPAVFNYFLGVIARAIIIIARAGRRIKSACRLLDYRREEESVISNEVLLAKSLLVQQNNSLLDYSLIRIAEILHYWVNF